ncbi:hypothetical protein C8R46DRAFT_1045505 [Mycena filopes]|nr:hypothetical protein C8R46DRAFT_1045505 [Mycena filopes]
MTALLDPAITQFEEMWAGKRVRTHNHPDGDFYRVAILAAIGDLLALKKALGCAGHASHNFCSYCKLKRKHIDRVDCENFEPRVGWEVLGAATAWLNAKTQKERKAIFAEHGTRWSAFHRLSYRDAVRHTVLGVMHGWIEGNLQHHARLKWGIGSDFPSGGGSAFDDASSDSDTEMMDVDQDALAAELEDLHRDSFVHDSAPASLSRRTSFHFIPESQDDVVGEQEDDEEEDEEEDEDAIYERERPSQKVFDSETMAIIHAGLAGVVIPAWIDRPPVNLGEKAHGKLKADNWFVLFSIFFPLIIPALWYGPSSSERERKLLNNFHDLIGATNILCSYATSPAEADEYTVIDAQEDDSESPVVRAMRVLSPRDPIGANSQSVRQLSRVEETTFNGSGAVLGASMYELIWGYWNQAHSPPYIRARSNLQIHHLGTGVNVFPTRAVELTHFTHKTRLFSTFKKHHGNSSISFRHPATGRKDMGFIQSIFSQVLQGQKWIFVVVQPHTDLTATDAAKTPYHTHPQFACAVRYSEPRYPRPQLIVEPRHIVSHVAYYQRPMGAFGIEEDITIFVDSLHRGRD